MVPFQPSGDKPIYCRECFGPKVRTSGKSFILEIFSGLCLGKFFCYPYTLGPSGKLFHGTTGKQIQHEDRRVRVRHSAFANRSFILEGKMSCRLQLISCQVVHGASTSISSILRICGIPRDDRTTTQQADTTHAGILSKQVTCLSFYLQ